MIRMFVLALKRLRKLVPRFYHGSQVGFTYKARLVGWRRIPPLSLLPYLTGDEIRLYLSLKPLHEGGEWQAGILQIEPPDLSKDDPLVVISNSVFAFIEFEKWPLSSPTPPEY